MPRVELGTFSLGVRCSIRLSYIDMVEVFYIKKQSRRGGTVCMCLFYIGEWWIHFVNLIELVYY